MLKRKASEFLRRWKASPSKKTVLVTGARQIGKTYLVRAFAKENYEHLAEVNFALDSAAKEIFTVPQTAREIMLRLSLVVDVPLKSGKTLIFLDEIQEAPEVMTSIKGLVEQGDFDFILSGSLLGVELRNITSNPVGFVTTLDMYPLDFEEFCWAMGVDSQVFDYLQERFDAELPIDTAVHDRMCDLFRKYLVVGGMPDAVQTLVDTDNLTMVRDVHQAVKDWYRNDISKYCPDADRLKAREAFDLVPSELNNPNKRFVLKKLNENARFRSYEDAFLWLTHANVALAAYNVDEPVSPLLASKSRNLFKLFYSDVGLLSSAFSRKAALDILNDVSEVNHGSTYENVVAQELVAHGFGLYYYNSKKFGELDFVIEDRDGDVFPIEVKSGKGYKRHNAITNVMDIENYHLKTGYVFCAGNIERAGKLLYLPLYLVSLLKND